MARLTEAERAELRRVADREHHELLLPLLPLLPPVDRFVAHTPEARKRYILWLTRGTRNCLLKQRGFVITMYSHTTGLMQ